ncbi:MAG: adenosylcobinamide-GDP ribazoletransferase [Negativicutes bacterium]|nr:adenosylcobinamide-GDP ribazoletransferase [Negativicutes bacterium]
MTVFTSRISGGLIEPVVSHVKGFVVALQFLTRFNFSRQLEVTPEELGRSVGYFPLVGAGLGLLLAGFSQAAMGRIPVSVLAVALILLEMSVTGGLHCDGLMDTMDGIFSGRSQERMLAIMKDSRVGAFGVMGFGTFLLGKWSLLLELLPAGAGSALLIMPVLGRFAAAVAICAFPYVRAEGLGKAFAEFAGRGTLCVALAWTLLFILPFGTAGVICLAAATGFAALFARYVQNLLGGLTGDVYGAVIELTEIVVLLTFLLVRHW